MSTGARLLAFFQERPGVIFEPSELVHEFGKSRDAIRKALARLHKSGLLECQSKVKPLENGNAVRYKVYYYPEMSSVTEIPSQSGVGTMDTALKTNLTQNSETGSVQSAKVSDSKGCNHDGHDGQKTQSLISTTTKTVSESETSILEIGSRVASNDPEKKSYNWHGKIVGFSQGGADVCWDERKGMQGGQVLWHRLTELRPLS
ncbi:MAG TPA: hypothetical protein ACFCUY_13140 [Xenococcaceae cyanobacterium]